MTKRYEVEIETLDCSLEKLAGLTFSNKAEAKCAARKVAAFNPCDARRVFVYDTKTELSVAVFPVARHSAR